MNWIEAAHGDLEHEDQHEHAPGEAERRAFARTVREQETIEFLTVGIDIGSSTSHLIFARVLFQRLGDQRIDRFVIVDRSIEWRSPILLTPFRADGTIDAAALSAFVQGCYQQAGLEQSDVGGGAVILTGEAIKRRNARAIDEALAGASGRFVCATAGNHMESVLAAHGSGATALSRARRSCGLHVDIGGGTTKLALIDNGEIRSVAALAAGGRLVAKDDSGSWSRAGEPARLVAADLGISTTRAALAHAGTRRQIAARFASLIVDCVEGAPPDGLGRALRLTAPLERHAEPEYLTFSGGVAEYLFGQEGQDYGDIAPELAAALQGQLRARVTIPVVNPGERIRATVIGASQFSMQASGRTIHHSGRAALPARNVPVVHLRDPLPDEIDSVAIARAFRHNAERQDTDTASAVALSFSWTGQLTYLRLAAVARAIAEVAGSADNPSSLLVVAVDADIAQSLGAILRDELKVRRELIVLDALELSQLDYIDVGEYRDPPGILPVVIKSLLFS